jgi:uncharacterized damage-inducible protein DinB
MSDPKYPVGPFEQLANPNRAQRDAFIDQISATPRLMHAAVAGLDEKQLETPYRDGGWTVRQVVHHVPDSHMNAYIRLKLALTEVDPVIKPYDEAKWAELADSRDTPIEVSLTLLEAVHTRFVTLLRSLTDADFARTFRHPEHGAVTIDWLLHLYAWHGRHHVGHIALVRAM